MKVLGIDYGKRKIGLAVGDTEAGLVEPLKTIFISSKSSGQIFQSFDKSSTPRLRLEELRTDFSFFRNIIDNEKIQKIVIGLTGGVIDREIRKFGEELQKASSLPVEFFDETLTTKDAQRVLIETRGNRKKRKAKEDAIAAAIMLESYMEGRLC